MTMDSLFQADMLPVAAVVRPSSARARGRRRASERAQKPVSQWPLDGSINVVLFAAMGGSCDGLDAAGLPVHIAINHDPLAVAVHQHRHPHTTHFQSDVREVCPKRVTGGRRVAVLWASPDCRHFSRAKGGAPVSKAVRSLPWIVCRWAGQVQPDVIFLENVRELRTWSPLIAKRDKATGRVIKIDGTVAAKGECVPLREQQLVPDPKRKGQTYRQWVKHIRGLGYAYEDRDLCCADYGIPTTRTRLFGVARRDGHAIAWPVRTHAPRGEAAALGLLPWVPASTIIDWSQPMQSIFGRKKPLAPATLRRTARGVIRYVLECAKPFLIPVTHPGDARIYDIDEPLRTVTSAHRGEIALVSAHISKHRGDSPGVSLDEPMPTLTAGSFIKRPGGCMPIGVVGAALTPYYGERRADEARGQTPDEPLPTISTGNRFAVIGAAMAPSIMVNNENNLGIDMGSPLPTVTTGNRHHLVAAFLEEHRTRSVGHDVTNPLPTVAAGDHHAVAGCLLKNYTGVVGSDLNAPIDTITAVDHHSVVAANLVKLRGTCADGQALDDPAPALTAGGNHVGVVASFLQHYYSEGGQDQDIRDPLHTVTTKARHGVVTVPINGETFVMADILLRMLKWFEAAAAHGFRRDCIPDHVVIDGKTIRLSQDRKMGFVGNSVPPWMAQSLAEANHVHTLYAPSRVQAAE